MERTPVVKDVEHERDEHGEAEAPGGACRPVGVGRVAAAAVQSMSNMSVSTQIVKAFQ